MRYVSWFSGIGGFDASLTKLGHVPVAFSEVDPYACAVYAKHWPNAVSIGDVCDLDSGDSLSAVLERSTGEEQQAGSLAPSVLIIENVPAWRRFGLYRVLQDLAAIGFDAEWTTLCSCLFGAPHHRARVFLLAYPHGHGESLVSIHEEVARLSTVARAVPWPDPPRGLGVVDGLPNRTHRLRCLGNAVVPAVVSWIATRLAREGR